MIVDAISDPVVGSWSDNIRSRYGRRHFFMFSSIIPLGISFWLVFAPPAGFGEYALFAWLAVSSIALRLTLTFFAAPASAVVAEISPLKSDRAEIGIYRQLISAVAQLGLLYVAFSIFFQASPEFANGQENAAAYPPFALVVSVAIMSFMLISASASYRHIRRFETTLNMSKGAGFSISKALKGWGEAILDLKNFRAVFLGLFFATTMGSTHRGISLYFGTYMWELDSDQIRNWQQIMLIGMLVMAIGARFVVQHVETKHAYLTGYFIFSMSYILPPALTIVGLMPAAGSEQMAYTLYVFNAAAGIGAGLLMIFSLIMFTEATDEFHFVKSVSQTGMLFGLMTFGNKAASGLGKIIAGWVTEAVDFPDKENIDLLTDQILFDLGLYVVLVMTVMGLIGFYFSTHNKRILECHAEILDGIFRLSTTS
jgi:Na+/melibiose symporter-like transporter